MARRVYLWSAWLFIASVVVQVFLIGLYLFANADLELHGNFGLVPFALSIAVLAAAFAARLPRRSKLWAGALFVATFVQMALPSLKESLPVVAALHPVNALLMFWLAVMLLRDAARGAGSTPAATAGGESAATAR